jgi:hypothetical protein
LGRNLTAALIAGLRRDAIFVSLASVYLVLGLCLVDLSAGAWLRHFGLALLGLTAAGALFASAIRGAYHVGAHRSDRPITAVIREVRQTSLATIVSFLPLVIAQMTLTTVFWRWKTQLPAFTWDQTLSELDRALHFGRLPWEWLQPLLGYWPVTYLIGANYNIWFMVMWSFWLAIAFGNRPQRQQYLVSFALLWIVLGSLMASLFASAGPCYFDRLVTVENPYAGLMAYLKAANEHATIFALETQDTLWLGYSGVGPDMGISAMPSLHNATALLMVLASKGFHPAVRWALKTHFLLIFLGSIHLGWHYAVDAYASFAMTMIIWYGAGVVVGKRTLFQRRLAET